MRRVCQRDIAVRGLTRERALAGALRLLDLGFFRVGSEAYTEENGSFGLATLRRSHAKVSGDEVRFDFAAKGGQRRVQAIHDPDLSKLTRALLARRGGGKELLGYRDGTTWRDIRSEDINAYLKELADEEVSAKDFRTWHATVLTAALLAAEEGGLTSVTSRKRVVSGVVKEVADALGNTPAVCRASYIDPRIVDRFLNGETIALPKGGTSPTTASGRRWRPPSWISWTRRGPSSGRVTLKTSGTSTDIPGMERDASGYGRTMQAPTTTTTDCGARSVSRWRSSGWASPSS